MTAEKSERTLRARALRAIRRIDRPLARFALKRWKDNDEITKATRDALMYGYGLTRIQHVPAKEAMATRRSVPSQDRQT